MGVGQPVGQRQWGFGGIPHSCPHFARGDRVIPALQPCSRRRCGPCQRIGPLFEKHSVFPAKTNTEFVEVLSRSHLKMKVWERGAGPTLACGTGACAIAVAAALEGRAECPCTVTLPGGDLHIDWRQSGDGRVHMTGPAVASFRGVWEKPAHP